MRASAVEADRVHNPKVVGSNPTPATKELKGTELEIEVSVCGSNT